MRKSIYITVINLPARKQILIIRIVKLIIVQGIIMYKYKARVYKIIMKPDKLIANMNTVIIYIQPKNGSEVRRY